MIAIEVLNKNNYMQTEGHDDGVNLSIVSWVSLRLS